MGNIQYQTPVHVLTEIYFSFGDSFTNLFNLITWFPHFLYFSKSDYPVSEISTNTLTPPISCQWSRSHETILNPKDIDMWENGQEPERKGGQYKPPFTPFYL